MWVQYPVRELRSHWPSAWQLLSPQALESMFYNWRNVHMLQQRPSTAKKDRQNTNTSFLRSPRKSRPLLTLWRSIQEVLHLESARVTVLGIRDSQLDSRTTHGLAWSQPPGSGGLMILEENRRRDRPMTPPSVRSTRLIFQSCFWALIFLTVKFTCFRSAIHDF